MKIVLCIEGAYSSSGLWSSIKTPVEVRRNGVGAFLVHLFGHKKIYKVEFQLLVDFFKRRVLDSNQWIPYDIGSLANCWFKPLTQPSVHLIFKSVQKYAFFLNLQNNLTKFFKNNGLAIFIAA